MRNKYYDGGTHKERSDVWANFLAAVVLRYWRVGKVDLLTIGGRSGVAAEVPTYLLPNTRISTTQAGLVATSTGDMIGS